MYLLISAKLTEVCDLCHSSYQTVDCERPFLECRLAAIAHPFPIILFPKLAKLEKKNNNNLSQNPNSPCAQISHSESIRSKAIVKPH